MKKLFALLFLLLPSVVNAQWQARTSCIQITSPVSNSTPFCVEMTSPPTLRYWDGAAWQSFVGTATGDVTDVLGTANEITSTSSGGPQPTLSLATQLSLGSKEFLSATPFRFEGATDDNVYTTLAITDPTGGRTLTVPDANSIAVQPTTCVGGSFFTAINATTGAVTCTAATVGPAGADTQVQFNDGGVLAGEAGLTYNKTTDILTAAGGFVGPLTGNVTGNLTGVASTATAFAANPADCAANQYATTIAASGNLTCAQVAFSQLTGAAEALALTDLSDVTAKKGTSATVQMQTGATATDDCAKFDVNGNLVSAGGSCTVGGGDLTEIQGTANEVSIASGTGPIPVVSIAPTPDLSGKALLGGAPLVFEGASADAFETSVVVTDPTADRNFTLPNADSAAIQPSAAVANQFMTGVSALGVISRAQPAFSDVSGAVTDAQVPNTITVDLAAAATALAANGANAAAGNAILGVDASGAAEGAFDVATQVELDAHLNDAAAAHAASAISVIAQGGIASTDVQAALEEIQSEIAGGGYSDELAQDAIGSILVDSATIDFTYTDATPAITAIVIDASITAAKVAADVATQAELDTHEALSGTSAHSATSTNTVSRIVTRDASGNFSAGTITAALNGTASLATALGANPANCSSGSAPGGISASGAVESCIDYATQTEFNAHLNDTSAAHTASAIDFTPNGSIAATDVQAAIQEVRDEVAASALDGSGAAGRVAFWTDANSFSSDTDFHWDSTNNWLGIGTGAPSFPFELSTPVTDTIASLESTGGAARVDIIGTTAGSKLGLISSTRRYELGSRQIAGSAGTEHEFVIDSYQSGGSFGMIIDGNNMFASIGHGGVPASRLDIAAGAIALTEMTAPSAPAANRVVIYAEDDGGGDTRLCAGFNSGDPQCFASQGGTGGATPSLEAVKDVDRVVDNAVSAGTSVEIGGTNIRFRIYERGAGDLVSTCYNVVSGIENDCDHIIALHAGNKWEIQDDAAGAIISVSEAGVTTYGSSYKPLKSVSFEGGALIGDGTQCPESASFVTINSGPKIATFICTDNDAATLFGSVTMPDAWDGGTVTFEHIYIQTAANTGVLNGDIAAQCRGSGETPSSTWGTEIAIDDAAVTGSNAIDHTTSAAVTPAGTCAGGDTLFFRYQLDATGTTTTIASLHHVGFKMEYSVSALSD